MCQQDCQKEDQQRCQKECQKRCQKECNVRRYARKNVRRCAKNVRQNVRRDCCRMLPVFLKHLCKQLRGEEDEPDIESNNNINNPHLTDTQVMFGTTRSKVFSSMHVGFRECHSYNHSGEASRSKGHIEKVVSDGSGFPKWQYFAGKLGLVKRRFIKACRNAFTRGSFGSHRFWLIRWAIHFAKVRRDFFDLCVLMNVIIGVPVQTMIERQTVLLSRLSNCRNDRRGSETTTATQSTHGILAFLYKIWKYPNMIFKHAFLNV